MKICKQCGHQCQDTETFCPRCGCTTLASDGSHKQPRVQHKPPQAQQVEQPQFRQPSQEPSRARQTQQAPAGYRNPNAIQPKPRPQQQAAQPQMASPQVRRPAQQRPQQDQAPQANDFGFEAPVEQEKKGLKKFGFGKKGKASQAQPQMQTRMQGQPQPQMQQPKMQPQMQQNMNTQQNYNPGYMGNGDDTVTVKEWLILFLRMLIPIYNLIYLFGASKGKHGVKPSMQSYCKIALILSLISWGIVLVSFFIAGSTVMMLL